MTASKHSNDFVISEEELDRLEQESIEQDMYDGHRTTTPMSSAYDTVILTLCGKHGQQLLDSTYMECVSYLEQLCTKKATGYFCAFNIDHDIYIGFSVFDRIYISAGVYNKYHITGVNSLLPRGVKRSTGYIINVARGELVDSINTPLCKLVGVDYGYARERLISIAMTQMKWSEYDHILCVDEFGNTW